MSKVQNISVFEPQEINGQIVEPLCIPAKDTPVAQTVAGATNLLWFAFHLSLAEGNKDEATRIGNFLKVVVDEGVGEEFAKDIDDSIDLLDFDDGTEYGDGNETPHS